MLAPFHNPLIRYFSGLIFYLLLPLTMLLFAWKAAVFPRWGSGLFCVAVAVVASHLMLPLTKFSWRSKALLSTGTALVVFAMIVGVGPVRRPFALFRANLSGRWLVGEDLGGADLNNANLTGANLSRASLTGAKLNDANLSNANLTGANLGGVDLSGANLSSAALRGAKLSHADLYGANLSGMDLGGTDLSGADLISANLSGAKLSDADLSGAILGGADRAILGHRHNDDGQPGPRQPERRHPERRRPQRRQFNPGAIGQSVRQRRHKPPESLTLKTLCK
jgi:Pentapeptide repeats (8 copies)